MLVSDTQEKPRIREKKFKPDLSNAGDLKLRGGLRPLMKSAEPDTLAQLHGSRGQLWNPKLRAVPSYYPMERSHRILRVDDNTLRDVTQNIISCLRVMSVQALFSDDPARAALLSSDQVEMQVYLWEISGGREICVEIQRRQGDSVAFHRYGRHLLDAAGGDFDPSEFHDYGDAQYLKAAEKLLKSELAKSNDRDDALVAIDIAASLLAKERLDARVLGLESLCILTDPRKSRMSTAMLASRAVILGSAGAVDEKNHETFGIFGKIHEFVVNLVVNKTMDDEQSLVGEMEAEYDSDDDDFFEVEEMEGRPPEYANAFGAMLQFALTILSNAWEVMTSCQGSTDSMQESLSSISHHFHNSCARLTNGNVMVALLEELARCLRHPHNAAAAAKCLGMMCQVSRDLRALAVELGGVDIARRAQLTGSFSHARLEADATMLTSSLLLREERH